MKADLTITITESEVVDHLADEGHERNSQDLIEAIKEALTHLDEKKRRVALMRLIDGLEFEKISEILHEPAGNLRSRFKRTLEELQRLLHHFDPST